MTGRLWYPQLDVYDSIRRIAALLLSYENGPGFERLYITDFFLANPPLLHKTQMVQSTRKAFTALHIPRPENLFLSYPAAPLLFHKMAPIQKEAIRALSGRGLLSMENLKRGQAVLTQQGRDFLTSVHSGATTDMEDRLIVFLVNDFAAGTDAGTSDLRRRTGLRRVA